MNNPSVLIAGFPTLPCLFLRLECEGSVLHAGLCGRNVHGLCPQEAEGLMLASAGQSLHILHTCIGKLGPASDAPSPAADGGMLESLGLAENKDGDGMRREGKSGWQTLRHT